MYICMFMPSVFAVNLAAPHGPMRTDRLSAVTSPDTFSEFVPEAPICSCSSQAFFVRVICAEFVLFCFAVCVRRCLCVCCPSPAPAPVDYNGEPVRSISLALPADLVRSATVLSVDGSTCQLRTRVLLFYLEAWMRGTLKYAALPN